MSKVNKPLEGTYCGPMDLHYCMSNKESGDLGEAGVTVAWAGAPREHAWTCDFPVAVLTRRGGGVRWRVA